MTEINPMKIIVGMQQLLMNPSFDAWVAVCLFITFLFFFLAVRVIPKYYKRKYKSKGEVSIVIDANIYNLQPEIEIQKVIAMKTSITIVLGTCYIYQWICERFSSLIDYYGLILIILILISNLINNHCISRMKLRLYDQEISDELGKTNTKKDVVSKIRLIGSIAALILEIVNFVVFERNIPLLTCMIALVLSKFIYFDTTFPKSPPKLPELLETIRKKLTPYLPYLVYMVVALILIAIYIGSGILFGVVDKGINGIIVVLVCVLIMERIIIQL